VAIEVAGVEIIAERVLAKVGVVILGVPVTIDAAVVALPFAPTVVQGPVTIGVVDVPVVCNKNVKISICLMGMKEDI